MKFGRKVASARALLDWSQSELAERTNLDQKTISFIEKSVTDARDSTLDKIQRALELAGIDFLPAGVQYNPKFMTIFEGDRFYLDLLDDVYYSLLDKRDAELLIMYGDDKLSPPEVNDRYRKMRNSGIKMRQLAEEGNEYLIGPLDEYRYIPKKFFNNYVTLVYGDKIAACADVNTKAVVFDDPLMAKTSRNTFNLLWSLLEKPERSVADERF